MSPSKRLSPEQMAKIGERAASDVDQGEERTRRKQSPQAPFSTQGRADSRAERRDEAVAFHSKVVEIDPARIRVSPANERAQELLTPESCADLIADIRNNGQHQPAEVIRDPENAEHFLLLSGSRRLFTAQHLERRLLAIVLPPGGRYDLRNQIERSRAENELHSKPNPIERCMQAVRFLDQGLVENQDELAEVLELDKSTISQWVRAGRLDVDVLKAIGADLPHLTVRLAYELASSGQPKSKLLSTIKTLDRRAPELDGRARVRAIVDQARGKKRQGSKPPAWKRLGDGVEWKLKSAKKPELTFRLPAKYREMNEDELSRLLAGFQKLVK